MDKRINEEVKDSELAHAYKHSVREGMLRFWKCICHSAKGCYIIYLSVKFFGKDHGNASQTGRWL